MRKHGYLVILILLLLVACNTEKSQDTQSTDATIETRMNADSTVGPTASIPISTEIPAIANTSTSTVAPILLTPSPRPTIPLFVTPDTDQLARWREYEKALAAKLIPSPIPEDVLCEWVILGQSEQEVYLWAFCQVSGEIPTGASVPAVVYLGTDDVVQSVEIPGDGSLYPADVHRLFPPYIQEMIFAHSVDVSKMKEHITARMKNLEPPLIVLSATSLP